MTVLTIATYALAVVAIVVGFPLLITEAVYVAKLLTDSDLYE